MDDGARIVDGSGINLSRDFPDGINNPILTSSVGRIDIHMTLGWPIIGHITSRITDNQSGSVGLRIMGRVPGSPDVSIWPNPNRGMVFLGGTVSNTFTGDVEVLDSNVLFLNKSFGATAIRGNIMVGGGSSVVLWQSNQLADTATITLDGRQHMSGFSFEAKNHTMTESFHRLVVKGEGLLYFYQRPNYRKLFLDDLLIESGGLLRVADWVDGVTKLLVRKDSEHLSESLKRIVFDNDKTKEAGLREYDKDYWEIGPGFPEPATYGAILLGVVCFVAKFRRRGRHKKAPTDEAGASEQGGVFFKVL